MIFEEFKGTGNAELKLDRKIAERRVFPAVDVSPSGTRKDELLLSADEFAIVHKLRRVLSGLDSHQAIDLLMGSCARPGTTMSSWSRSPRPRPAWPTSTDPTHLHLQCADVRSAHLRTEIVGRGKRWTPIRSGATSVSNVLNWPTCSTR